MARPNLDQWREKLKEFDDIVKYRETTWFNPQVHDKYQASAPVTFQDIEDAAQRLDRFRPLLQKLFPDLTQSGGMIESPLIEIPAMQKLLAEQVQCHPSGRLFLKADNLLPVAGSIKARGGIYEVLQLAEKIALKNNILTYSSDYSVLSENPAREIFNRHRIRVGSTGNLGLSIGIMGTRLGFQVTVHMSADARQWKKELLRSHGAEVVEHSGDYETAVREGRNLASNDPCCHFVDDEHSRDLFLGYSVAALRLRDQLREQAIKVDANHPLFVYLPCGVGGGPGGITFGLNQVFGKAVHCFFVEPTHSPAVLLGLATGLHEQVSVADFGLDNKTAADGLAVGRPSGFAGKILKNVIAGVMTVSDETLFYYLACLHDLEKIDMEPSALAGMVGMGRILTSTQYLRDLKLIDKLEHTTHIVWGTGGSLVPETEMAAYYQRGQQYLQAKNQSTASSTTQ